MNAKAAYPRVKEENLPFLCMDLAYQYTLLVEGFGRLKFELTFLSFVQVRDDILPGKSKYNSLVLFCVVQV